MNKLKKFLKTKHKGFSGVVLIASALLGFLVMIFLLQLSADSKDETEAENASYIASVSTANDLFIKGVQPFSWNEDAGAKGDQSTISFTDASGSGGSIENPGYVYKQTLDNFRATQDTNMMVHTKGSWVQTKNGFKLTIQYAPFKNNVGDMIAPVERTIEVYHNN